ncbi:B1 bradykinin receptor-like [Babylonia areolata]|uniref:B1 bradykinin receptor-like n=1 Tax=Babylonia areolata TaxID=304850 RepID=UPI003FD42E5F
MWSASAPSDMTATAIPSALSNVTDPGTFSGFSLAGSASAPTSPSTPSFQEVLESCVDYRLSVAAWRICPPCILLLGTAGNLMTLWVFSGPSSSSSSSSSSSMSMYFKALAVSDLVLLYTGLLRHWVKYLFLLDVRDTHSAICRLHSFLVYVSGVTSAWFLVLMTSQRALCVVWPHRTRQLQGRRAAGLAMAVTVVASAALNAHILYGYTLRYYPNHGRYYCDYLHSDYEDFIRGVWPWVDLTAASLLPFGFLLVSNSLLMWKVATSVRDVKQLTSSGRNSQGKEEAAVSNRRKTSTSLTLTLVFLSAMFVLLTSPICVFLVLDYYYDYFRFTVTGEEDAQHVAATELGWALTNLLWYANSALNFYLYCLSGARFRAMVWQRLSSCGGWRAGLE